MALTGHRLQAPHFRHSLLPACGWQFDPLKGGRWENSPQWCETLGGSPSPNPFLQDSSIHPSTGPLIPDAPAITPHHLSSLLCLHSVIPHEYLPLCLPQSRREGRQRFSIDQVTLLIKGYRLKQHLSTEQRHLVQVRSTGSKLESGLVPWT